MTKEPVPSPPPASSTYSKNELVTFWENLTYLITLSVCCVLLIVESSVSLRAITPPLLPRHDGGFDELRQVQGQTTNTAR